jgi:hypothetical protein
MKLDMWKVSTLVFGGALVLIVGSGGVRETAACDMEDVSAPPPPSRSTLLLRAAEGSLDRAGTQLKAVNSDRGGHRAKALGHLALAMDEVQKAVAISEAPVPKPRPMRPVMGGTKAKVVLHEME